MIKKFYNPAGNYQQALGVVLGVLLCLYGAVFASAKPADSHEPKSNVVILVEDPRPATKPAPASKPANAVAPKTITVEKAKDKPVVKLDEKEGEILSPPGAKTSDNKSVKVAAATQPAKKAEPVKVEAPAKKTVAAKDSPEKKLPPKPVAVKPAKVPVVKPAIKKPISKVPAAKPKVKTVAKKKVVPTSKPAPKAVAMPARKPQVGKNISTSAAKVASPKLSSVDKKAQPKVKIPQPKSTPGQQAQAESAKPGMNSREMHEMIMKLQMYNADLMQELQKGRQQNYKLIRALRESRKHSSDLQTKLNKQELELQIKKLREGGKVEVEAPEDQLARQNKIMKLQLELMKIDQPKRYATMLEKVSQLSTEKDKVWSNNRRLNELLSKQTNISEQRQEEINVIRPKLLQSEKEIAKLRMEIKQLKASLTNPTPVKSVVVTRPASSASADSAKPAAKPVTAVSDSRLIGKIISIDDQIIKINIGSLKGLQAGMRLIVYRRDKFVGYMRVDIVGETTAAGSMSREILTPQVGDNVTDRL